MAVRCGGGSGGVNEVQMNPNNRRLVRRQVKQLPNLFKDRSKVPLSFYNYSVFLFFFFLAVFCSFRCPDDNDERPLNARRSKTPPSACVLFLLISRFSTVFVVCGLVVTTRGINTISK